MTLTEKIESYYKGITDGTVKVTTAEQIAIVAEHLNVEPDELCHLLTPEENALLDAYEKHPEAQQKVNKLLNLQEDFRLDAGEAFTIVRFPIREEQKT